MHMRSESDNLKLQAAHAPHAQCTQRQKVFVGESEFVDPIGAGSIAFRSSLSALLLNHCLKHIAWNNSIQLDPCVQDEISCKISCVHFCPAFCNHIACCESIRCKLSFMMRTCLDSAVDAMFELEGCSIFLHFSYA